MNNEPDYNNNLAFAPGDWSDSRVVGNTDRTVSTIRLIEKIEKLEKESDKLRQLLKDMYKKTESYLVGEKNGFKELGWHEKAAEFDNLLTRINAAIGESEA